MQLKDAMLILLSGYDIMALSRGFVGVMEIESLWF